MNTKCVQECCNGVVTRKRGIAMYDESMYEEVELEEFEVSAEDLREWQLANAGMTEADLPYSMRTVSII